MHIWLMAGHMSVLPRQSILEQLYLQTSYAFVSMPRSQNSDWIDRDDCDDVSTQGPAVGQLGQAHSGMEGLDKARQSSYASEIVQTKHEITRIRKGVHHQKSVGKHPPDIRKVEQNMTICVISFGSRDIGFHASDRIKVPTRCPLMQCPLQAARPRWLS